MKVFERGGKINFVDDNNVFVGFDYGADCCEQFGWFLSENLPTQIEDENGSEIDPTGFQFDPDFFEENLLGESLDCGGSATFKLKKPEGGAVFLTIYNAHNGYYGHGFEVAINGQVTRDGVL